MDNAYGALNLSPDGTTPRDRRRDTRPTRRELGPLLIAENNWWGLHDIGRARNPGPAITPTTNPHAQENGVNGTATTETATGADDLERGRLLPVPQRQPGQPEYGPVPVLTAPLPVSDAAPTVGLAAPATAKPGDAITLTASRPTTSASSACASPTARRRSAPSRCRRTARP